MSKAVNKQRIARFIQLYVFDGLKSAVVGERLGKTPASAMRYIRSGLQMIGWMGTMSQARHSKDEVKKLLDAFMSE